MVFATIVAAVIGYVLFAGGNQNSSLDSASQLWEPNTVSVNNKISFNFM